MTTGFLGISGYGGHCNSEETIIHIKSFSQWTRGSKNWRHKTYSFLYIQFGRPISHSDKYIYYSKSKLGNVLLSIIKGATVNSEKGIFKDALLLNKSPKDGGNCPPVPPRCTPLILNQNLGQVHICYIGLDDQILRILWQLV